MGYIRALYRYISNLTCWTERPPSGLSCEHVHRDHWYQAFRKVHRGDVSHRERIRTRENYSPKYGI